MYYAWIRYILLLSQVPFRAFIEGKLIAQEPTFTISQFRSIHTFAHTHLHDHMILQRRQKLIPVHLDPKQHGELTNTRT